MSRWRPSTWPGTSRSVTEREPFWPRGHHWVREDGWMRSWTLAKTGLRAIQPGSCRAIPRFSGVAEPVLPTGDRCRADGGRLRRPNRHAVAQFPSPSSSLVSSSRTQARVSPGVPMRNPDWAATPGSSMKCRRLKLTRSSAGDLAESAFSLLDLESIPGHSPSFDDAPASPDISPDSLFAPE